MHARPTTAARPTTPVVQLDEDTIRNALIESDDDPFARVEGVRMLKPAVKRGKARSVENVVDDDDETDMGTGMTKGSVSSHRHHRREPAGGVTRLLRL